MQNPMTFFLQQTRSVTSNLRPQKSKTFLCSPAAWRCTARIASQETCFVVTLLIFAELQSSGAPDPVKES